MLHCVLIQHAPTRRGRSWPSVRSNQKYKSEENRQEETQLNAARLVECPRLRSERLPRRSPNPGHRKKPHRNSLSLQQSKRSSTRRRYVKIATKTAQFDLTGERRPRLPASSGPWHKEAGTLLSLRPFERSSSKRFSRAAGRGIAPRKSLAQLDRIAFLQIDAFDPRQVHSRLLRLA
jgi:hypothetical protein